MLETRLYTREKEDQYIPASGCLVFAEANRLCDAQLKKGELITSSSDAKSVIGWKIRHHTIEVFACLFLDNSHRCLGFEEICTGTINCNTVHPREVIKAIFRYDAAAVIFAHNHPSGNSEPSKQDIELTEQFVALLTPLSIRVLDHLIVGNQITSLADNNLM